MGFFSSRNGGADPRPLHQNDAHNLCILLQSIKSHKFKRLQLTGHSRWLQKSTKQGEWGLLKVMLAPTSILNRTCHFSYKHNICMLA